MAQALPVLRFSSRGLSILVAVLIVAEAVFGIGLLYFAKLLVDVVSEQFGEAGNIERPARVFLYLGLIGLMMVLTVAFQRLAE